MPPEKKAVKSMLFTTNSRSTRNQAVIRMGTLMIRFRIPASTFRAYWSMVEMPPTPAGAKLFGKTKSA